VIRDPAADTLIVSLNSSALPGLGLSYGFQVFLANPGSQVAADTSAVILSNGQPPERAPVLLAFWNTLPAYTPALALRRWDGAHTGPLGGRHGLHNLLRAARSRGIPLVLLDLKTPSALSALDYAGGLELVQDMSANGLLILPENTPVFPAQSPEALPTWALTRIAAESRLTGLEFGLPASPFLYTHSGEEATKNPLFASYTLVFTPVPPNPEKVTAGTSPIRVSEQRVIPISPVNSGDLLSLTEDEGAPLALRQRLVQAALQAGRQPGTGKILILGGDLPQTAWGDPAFARAAMDYLIDHPWIRLLGAADLLAYSHVDVDRPAAGEFSQTNPETITALDAWLDELRQAPPGPLGQAAWQAWEMLAAPVSPFPSALPSLRLHYSGQVGLLLAAARWSVLPAPAADCSQDLDLDGSTECVLASDRVFALFEPGSSSLSSLFILDDGSTPHQLIASSAQFITGLSSPEGWDLTSGDIADPAVLPGAFRDDRGPYQIDQVEQGRLVFSSLETRKTYILTPNGLRVEIQGENPLPIQLPLAVDPWARFTPGWGNRYVGEAVPGGWSWGLAGGVRASVLTSQEMVIHEFTASRSLVGTVEDPNRDYPPGHFLPFPMAVVEVQGSRDIILTIELLP
jgi:hypothetical protein